MRALQFRVEMRWPLAVGATIALAALCAGQFAQAIAPCDAALARVIARGHAWQILSVEAAEEPESSGAFLRLTAAVHRDSARSSPAALVISRVQAGAVIETPLVFWTTLLLWPVASAGARRYRLVLGLPAFFLLHTVTTVAQLMAELPAASAIVAGQTDAWTLAEHWSQFLEAGGRIAIELCAALLTVAAADRCHQLRRQPDHPGGDDG